MTKLSSQTFYTFLPVGYDELGWELGERPLFNTKDECRAYVKSQKLPYRCHVIKIDLSEEGIVAKYK